MEEQEVSEPDFLNFQDEENEPIEESALEDLTKIVSYNIANTVEVLKLKIDNNEIELKPEFQRDFVWDMNRASLFIDSLLTGLPIPSIFLGKNKEEESYIVIDGQQRLKSAYYYITGKFVNNDSHTIFALRGLKDREWNGKTYDELDGKLQRRIKNAVLNTTIIEDINFRPKVVHDLFHRLNTGGVPLTDQEIRNCVYSGVFNKQLMDLNDYPNWRLLLGKATPERRLRDVELVLRFFALFYDLDIYKESMREFLSRFQDNNKKNSEFIGRNEIIFKSTVDVICEFIGPKAFKIVNTINKSVCDSVMVSIAQLLQSDKASHMVVEAFRRNHNRLLRDADYLKAVTVSTSSVQNVHDRITIARNCFLGLR